MVLLEMYNSGGDPSDIVESKGLGQIKDEGEIEKIAKEIISNNPKAVEDYKGGKNGAIQFLVGQMMAKTRGKASPEATREILLRRLTTVK